MIRKLFFPKVIPVWACFLAPAVLVTVMAISMYSEFRELKEQSPLTEVQGKVARLDCDNHGKYSVLFSAEGKSVLGEATSSAGRRDCSSMTIGQTLSVWYSHNEPRYISFVPPSELSTGIKGEMWAMIFVGYPLFVIFLLATRRLSRK